MNQDKIGNFIKSIRQENNLTQKELADRLGVTFQAVSKWENGKNVPDIGIMKQICDEFHLNIDDILNGEKKEQERKKRNIWSALIPVLFVLLGIIIVNLIQKEGFEFTTISSKCSAFKITGSAAYNQDKSSIYISNIEFCGKEDKNIYQEINCILYEKEKDKQNTISSCEKRENITLEEFLKEVNIQVDSYSTMCKKLTSSTMMIEITAITKDQKEVTYTIPLEWNDKCK